jgi:hypothetical protein
MKCSKCKYDGIPTRHDGVFEACGHCRKPYSGGRPVCDCADHSHDEDGNPIAIPSVFVKDDYWKCPQCGNPRPLPLRHDPMPPEPDGRVVCSQCGMHGDLTKTECPGHGANWGEPVAWCTCGEFGPAPAKFGETLTCKRCGKQYPHYEPAPPALRRGRALTAEDAELLDKLRALLSSGKLTVADGGT